MTSPSDHDPVNRPAHYTFSTFETIDVLEAWFRNEPLLWQVGKYISRWDRKGEPLQDLRKARFYLDRKIAQLEEHERVREQAIAEESARAEEDRARLQAAKEAALLTRQESDE